MAKERRCGTCKYWEDTEETIGLINERLGRCNFADGYIPFLGLQGVFVVEGNGDDCPDWKEREEGTE